jgi:hypothetical protein
MKVVDTTQIYSFAPIAAQNDFAVSPSEQLITLTIGQLQELITQAVQKAIQPIQDEIASLKEQQTQNQAEFERFKAAHRAFAVQTTNDLDALFEANLKPTATPQLSTKTTTKKTSDHIDELHRLMVEDRTQQISIAKGARLLGISKERLRQLKPFIMQDGRFELGWSTVKGKKAVVIKIRQFLK